MRKVITICIFLFLLLLCTGCDGTTLQDRAELGGIRYENLSCYVVADKETHILYYKLSETYMCPYYSANGKMCKYEDGHIIEIGE